MKTTLLYLLVLIAFSFAAVEKCISNESCNIINPNAPNEVGTKRCDILNRACASLGGVAWKSIPGLNEHCTDSFRYFGICQKFAGEGCTIGTANPCHPGLILKDGKCTRFTLNFNVTYVGENEECDILKLCKRGLVCHRGVCRKKLAAGSVCNNKIDCLENHVCNFGKCVREHSLDDGLPAETSKVCKSGHSKNNICVPRTRSTCYTNADCDGDAVCKRNGLNDDKPGVCVNWGQYYYQEYLSCLSSCYGSDINEDADCTKCKSAYTKYMCGTYCTKRRDERYVTDPFKFDCKAFTMTEITECELSEQFVNCDAVYSWSGASSLSFGLISVIALFVFLF